MTTFTKHSPGTPNPSAGTFSGASTSSVSGSAVKVRARQSEEIRYRELGLVVEQVITLLFTPDTYGDTPAMGARVEWPAGSGVEYEVHTVETIAPDGVTIAARVGIAR
jgi:hypothetical protein